MTLTAETPMRRDPDTTSVIETADRLYVQNLHADRLGWSAK